MNAKPFFVTRQQYDLPLNIVGEQVTVLASGEKTGGYEIFLQEGPEGSGPPPHSHPWDESFFVIKGEVEFSVGEEKTWGSAGTLVHIPADTFHWFRFCEGGATMLSITSRLGASKMFQDLHREISPTQPDLGKLIEIGTRHGLSVAC